MAELNKYFFESKNVKVFPCAYRGITDEQAQITFDPESRLNTEYNFVHGGSFNNILKSYVVDYSYSEQGGILKCVVGGYYFEISGLSLAELYKYFTVNEASKEYRVLCINPIVKQLSPGGGDDSARSTEVLGDFSNTSRAETTLDKKLENGLSNTSAGDPVNMSTYRFTGLAIVDGDAATIKSYKDKGWCLDFINTLTKSSNKYTITIKGDAKLPEVYGGTGIESIVAGRSSQAAGNNAFAAGTNSQADGNNSFAIGNNAEASGANSFATGAATNALGEYSVAVGNSNTANGIASFAAGTGTTATGENTAAFGQGTQTTTNQKNAFVIGQFNDPQVASLLEIGNGASDGQRSNIVVVNADGIIDTENFQVNKELAAGVQTNASSAAFIAGVDKVKIEKTPLIVNGINAVSYLNGGIKITDNTISDPTKATDEESLLRIGNLNGDLWVGNPKQISHPTVDAYKSTATFYGATSVLNTFNANGATQIGKKGESSYCLEVNTPNMPSDYTVLVNGGLRVNGPLVTGAGWAASEADVEGLNIKGSLNLLNSSGVTVAALSKDTKGKSTFTSNSISTDKMAVKDSFTVGEGSTRRLSVDSASGKVQITGSTESQIKIGTSTTIDSAAVNTKEIICDSLTVRNGIKADSAGKATSVDDSVVRAIFDKLYPIGSIYISLEAGASRYCPIPYGTWERITDRFLYAGLDSGDYAVNKVGGQKDAIVVEHSHLTGESGAHEHIMIEAGAHTHKLSLTGTEHDQHPDNDCVRVAKHDKNGKVTFSTDDRNSGIKMDYDGTHTHPLSKAVSHKHTVSIAGQSGTGMNMPPYLCVYMWKRTK